MSLSAYSARVLRDAVEVRVFDLGARRAELLRQADEARFVAGQRELRGEAGRLAVVIEELKAAGQELRAFTTEPVEEDWLT